MCHSPRLAGVHPVSSPRPPTTQLWLLLTPSCGRALPPKRDGAAGCWRVRARHLGRRALSGGKGARCQPRGERGARRLGYAAIFIQRGFQPISGRCPHALILSVLRPAPATHMYVCSMLAAPVDSAGWRRWHGCYCPASRCQPQRSTMPRLCSFFALAGGVALPRVRVLTLRPAGCSLLVSCRGAHSFRAVVSGLAVLAIAAADYLRVLTLAFAFSILPTMRYLCCMLCCRLHLPAPCLHCAAHPFA